MKRQGGNNYILLRESQGFPGGSVVRNPPANLETWVQRSGRSPGVEDGRAATEEGVLEGREMLRE